MNVAVLVWPELDREDLLTILTSIPSANGVRFDFFVPGRYRDYALTDFDGLVGSVLIVPELVGQKTFAPLINALSRKAIVAGYDWLWILGGAYQGKPKNKRMFRQLLRQARVWCGNSEVLRESLLIPSDIFGALKGFDERFYEGEWLEHDLVYRAVRLGAPLSATPLLKAEPLSPPLASTLTPYFALRNRFLFARLHWPWWQRVVMGCWWTMRYIWSGPRARAGIADGWELLR